MSEALTAAIEGRPRRRQSASLGPEFPPPPPPWYLSMIRLPPWFAPALRDLMEVAERTFGRDSGPEKKRWVREAMLNALVLDLGAEPDDFAPVEFRADLVDLLIEGLWSLQFRDRPEAGGHLTTAIAKLKALGGTLRAAQESRLHP